MLRSQVRISRQSGSLQRGLFHGKRYSSTTTPPLIDQSTETTSNKTEQQTEVAKTSPIQQEALKARETAAVKKRISVKGHSSTTTSTISIITRAKLPSVPSTQYLDSPTVKKDMFFGGFRPLLTPIRRPVVKSSKKPTIPPTWNLSACRLETFDDYTNVPQFVVDKLIPFNVPQGPGNEIRLGLKSQKEVKESERLSKEVLQFIKHFRK